MEQGSTVHRGVLNHLTVEEMRGDAFRFTSEPLIRVLSDLSLSSFDQLSHTYGHEVILTGEEGAEPYRNMTVKQWVDLIRNGLSIVESRLSEPTASHFINSRPTLFNSLARELRLLLPIGFRAFMDERVALNPKVPEGDDYNDVFLLWAAPNNYGYKLHQDFVTGSLLTHIEGKKSVYLFPPNQTEFLYLKDGNAESVSEVDVRNPDLTLHPFFEKASPFVIHLKPMESIYIPCGWAHYIEYHTSGMSFGVNVMPDHIKSNDFDTSSCAELS